MRSTRLPRALRCAIETLEDRHLLAVDPTGSLVAVNATTIGGQHLPADISAVAALADGSLAAAYFGREAGDRAGVFVRLFDAQGAARGGVVRVNETLAGGQSNAAVAPLPGGGFVVAWEGRGAGDRYGVFARWFDADGDALTAETLVNQTTGGVQSRPQLGVDSAGAATIVWQGVGAGDFDGIWARRFSSAGAALGVEARINTTVAREQAFADLAVADDGASLITWSSRHQDGGDWGIYAQRLAANGDKVGDEFRVNATTSGSQVAASVVTLDAGFAVAWESRGQDGDGWGIFAQRLNAAGVAVGAEFRINQTTTGNQRQVALASFDGDSVLAAWIDGQSDGTGWNVVAREVELTASTPSFENEFDVHPATSTQAFGHQLAPSVVAIGERAAVAWSGDGTTDRDGVYLQRYALIADLPNVAPNLAPIPGQSVRVGERMEVTVTATDQNANDTLTFLLDPDNLPAGATLTQISNTQAVVRWTPQAGDAPGLRQFRVVVIDDGDPRLSDSETFVVSILTAS